MRNFMPVVSVLTTAIAVAAVTPASAELRRNPLRIDVPDRPRHANTTLPTLYKCSALDNCQKQAADFCKTFNYPNGKILFRDLPASPRPFPIYSVICFD